MKQFQVVRVISRIIVIDLDPLSRARPAVWLERGHVIPGELQFRRRRCRQSNRDAAAVNAGEHLSVDEVSGQARHVARFDTGNLEEQGIEYGLGSGAGRISFQR